MFLTAGVVYNVWFLLVSTLSESQMWFRRQPSTFKTVELFGFNNYIGMYVLHF